MGTPESTRWLPAHLGEIWDLLHNRDSVFLGFQPLQQSESQWRDKRGTWSHMEDLTATSTACPGVDSICTGFLRHPRLLAILYRYP